jgi:predicted house-cleaning noncanonical NTP pyrophosphatase (MazG superfamily)
MGREKLVRDGIPDLIRASGVEPVIRVADATEYRPLLRAKLTEEVDEFLASDDPAELADVLEVVFALAAQLGVDRDTLERHRESKAAERGGFAGRTVWCGNAVTGPRPGDRDRLTRHDLPLAAGGEDPSVASP